MFGKRGADRTAAATNGGEPCGPRDRRRHPRYVLAVGGRYMLSSGEEFRCHTMNVSAVGVAINGPAAGRQGGRVIVYLDRLGRVEGSTRRITPLLFAIEMANEGAQFSRFRLELEDVTHPPALAPNEVGPEAPAPKRFYGL